MASSSGESTQQSQGGDDAVEHALDDAPGTGELRLADLQQGERADGRTLTRGPATSVSSGVSSSAVVAAFELPGEPAQPLAAEHAGAGDGDGVGSHFGRGAAGFGRSADDRDARREPLLADVAVQAPTTCSP